MYVISNLVNVLLKISVANRGLRSDKIPNLGKIALLPDGPLHIKKGHVRETPDWWQRYLYDTGLEISNSS